MTTKSFISTVIAASSVGVTNIAISASPYISNGKPEEELPYIIIGGISGISLFLLVNWIFKPRPKKSTKTSKRRR